MTDADSFIPEFMFPSYIVRNQESNKTAYFTMFLLFAITKNFFALPFRYGAFSFSNVLVMTFKELKNNNFGNKKLITARFVGGIYKYIPLQAAMTADRQQGKK